MLLDGLIARSPGPELMDDPAAEGPGLQRTLAEIETLNRLLRGYAPSLGGVQALLPHERAPFSVLDVGLGTGDAARRIVDWARAEGREISVRGVELSDSAVAYARARCAGYPEIEVERADLFALPDGPAYDVVHASQVLHHFGPEDAVRALAKMLGLSRRGVVVNDLHRHPVPWAFIRGATRALSNNPMIRYDAPMSVRRGFVRGELEAMARAAGATRFEVGWCALFRWRLLLFAAP